MRIAIENADLLSQKKRRGELRARDVLGHRFDHAPHPKMQTAPLLMDHTNGIPDIDPQKHRLMVHGMVSRPLTYTMEELKRFPSVSRIHFLECNANSRPLCAGPTASRCSSFTDARAPASGRACCCRCSLKESQSCHRVACGHGGRGHHGGRARRHWLGIWSLVFFQVVQTLIRTVLVWWVCSWRTGGQFALTRLKHTLSFVSGVLTEQGLRSNDFIAARALPEQQMSAITLGY